MGDANIDKIVKPEEFPCAKKGSQYFAGYTNDEEATPLCALLPKMSVNVKKSDGAKTMYFLMMDEKLLKIYNKIWREIKKIMKRKNFDSDPVFGDKCLKTKVKSYNNKITKNFHGAAPNKGIEHFCLSAIVIGFVLKSGKN